MRARIVSVLVVALLILVVGVLSRAMRNALKGVVNAGRMGRYVRSSAPQLGFEPDTVLGWLLAIVSMLLAVLSLTGLVVYVLHWVWL